jgi:hypothetical protein
VKIIKNIVTNNISELALYPGDDGITGQTVSLPSEAEETQTDYVTIRSTNAGVHHAFSTAGNYYYANALVPSYASLPTLTSLQIGGSDSVSFSEGFLTYGYHNAEINIFKGYYIVFGYLDVSPTNSVSQYINYGIGYSSSNLEENFTAFKNFSTFDREYLNFNYYISPATTTTYYFTFQTNANIVVNKSKCTFIRIA